MKQIYCNCCSINELKQQHTYFGACLNILEHFFFGQRFIILDLGVRFIIYEQIISGGLFIQLNGLGRFLYPLLITIVVRLFFSVLRAVCLQCYRLSAVPHHHQGVRAHLSVVNQTTCTSNHSRQQHQTSIDVCTEMRSSGPGPRLQFCTNRHNALAQSLTTRNQPPQK